MKDCYWRWPSWKREEGNGLMMVRMSMMVMMMMTMVMMNGVTVVEERQRKKRTPSQLALSADSESPLSARRLPTLAPSQPTQRQTRFWQKTAQQQQQQPASSSSSSAAVRYKHTRCDNSDERHQKDATDHV
jgi:hypothetical protein